MLDTPLGNLRDYDYDLARIWAAAVRAEHATRHPGDRLPVHAGMLPLRYMLIQPDAWRRHGRCASATRGRGDMKRP